MGYYTLSLRQWLRSCEAGSRTSCGGIGAMLRRTVPSHQQQQEEGEEGGQTQRDISETGQDSGLRTV